jgi:O-antigen/teichoic acid export membrane protein
MGESLKAQTIRGVIWSGVDRFSVQGIQFVLSIILARLVAPSEYGLIAMLGIFLAIAQVFTDSGFSNALMQKKDRTENDYATVFYFNIAVAGVVYLILFIGASYIAKFYNEPILEIITKWVGLNIVISAFSIVQSTKLTIRLDFKTQTKVSLTAVIASGTVGVAMAFGGYGVWALVAQSLLRSLLNTILLWIFTKWKPVLIFSYQSFKTLFSFGSKLLASTLMHTIYMELYTLIIGRKFSSASAGYFNRAQTLARFPPMNIIEIASRVMYPSLCSIQDEEERLTRAFIRFLRIGAFIIFPLMVGMVVLARPLIQVVLTDKWLPAVPLFSILGIAYMLHSIGNVNWQILSVRGRSDLSLKAEVIRKIISFAILFTTIPFGITIMCWGILCCQITDYIVLIFYVRKVIPVGYWMEIRALAPILLAVLLMGTVVYIVMHCFSAPMVQLALGAVSGVVFYVGICMLLKLPEVALIMKNPLNVFKNV